MPNDPGISAGCGVFFLPEMTDEEIQAGIDVREPEAGGRAADDAPAAVPAMGDIPLPPGLTPEEMEAIFVRLYEGLPDLDESEPLTIKMAARWSENAADFISELTARWIALLPADRVPRLSAIVLAGPEHNVFVQFGRFNAARGTLPYEAVSNRFLEGPAHLGAVDEARLIALGFEAPLNLAVKGEVIGPNWFREVKVAECSPAKLATHALTARWEVYGVPPAAVTLTPVWEKPVTAGG